MIAMTISEREQLLDLTKKYYSEQKITLSSGKPSSFYIDGKMITLSAKGSFLTATLLKPWLIDDGITAVGGLTIGADPMAAVISALSYTWEKQVKAFIVRKETKGHGKQKDIEGPLSKDDIVCLVDDVVTTGASVLLAAEKIEQIGAKIVSVYALVDRLEGARENIEARGYKFKSIFTVNDLKKNH
jgi:orotate phosphoribosyltransferase